MKHTLDIKLNAASLEVVEEYKTNTHKESRIKLQYINYYYYLEETLSSELLIKVKNKYVCFVFYNYNHTKYLCKIRCHNNEIN